MQPLLTTCLLVAERYIRPELHVPEVSDSWISSLANTISASTFVAAFAIITLSDCDVRDYALSFIPLAALLLVYVAFRPKSAENIHFLPFVNPEAAIFSTGLRVVIILLVVMGLELFIFGLPNDGFLRTVTLGVVKALSWFFTSKTIYRPYSTGRHFEGTSPPPKNRHASWTIATTIRTFSLISVIDNSMQSSEAKAVSQVVASYLLLGQLVYLLPKQAKARHLLCVFALFPIALYVANVFTIRDSVLSTPSNVGHSWKHPIEVLVRDTRADFEH